MKVLPEIGENSVSSYLWDGKTESKILRQFLIKGSKRLGISLCQYPPLFFAKACLSYFAIPISIVASIGGLELLQLRMQGSERNWHCHSCQFRFLCRIGENSCHEIITAIGFTGPLVGPTKKGQRLSVSLLMA